MPWSQQLSEIIELDDGSTLITLADARGFVLALPAAAQLHGKWQRMAGILLSAARTGRDDLVCIATAQLKEAFQHPPYPHVGLAPAKTLPASSGRKLTKRSRKLR
jgi:hypothetical protein